MTVPDGPPICSLCHTTDGLTSTDPTICFVCKRLRESVKSEMRAECNES